MILTINYYVVFFINDYKTLSKTSQSNFFCFSDHTIIPFNAFTSLSRMVGSRLPPTITPSFLKGFLSNSVKLANYQMDVVLSKISSAKIITHQDLVRWHNAARHKLYYYLYTEDNCEQKSSIDSVAQTEHAELSGSVVESPAAFYGEVRLFVGVPAWSHPSTSSRWN